MDVDAVGKAYAQLLSLIQQHPGQDTYTFSFPEATPQGAEALREAAQHVVMNLHVGITLIIAGVTYRV